MPKVKTTVPEPDRHKGERNVDPLYLVRPYFNWNYPGWVEAKYWRTAVQQQEICMICRETLIGNIMALDWKVEARDSTQRDELKEEAKYYTKLFEYTGDYDYSQIIEWGGSDYLDLPFGFGAEIGRMDDNPDGRVVWIELLDGTTLFPTLNSDWPVGQYVPESGEVPRFFPKHAIDRIYMSPRTEIKRKGWGMPPPEKIFMALNMISRGDLYYAGLLLDTPEAGMLDLIDMSREGAEQWVKAWRESLYGVDPYKIAVIYEHTQAAQWIPFTRPPQELMFTDALNHYISIVTSGYGLTPGDIGLSNPGGRTLAGAIRDERKTKRNGYARMKIKLVEFFNRILPDTLRFRFIDLDDEVSVALGRARLANATAWTSLVNLGAFSADEARQQTIADGLISISIPEEVPPEVKKLQQQKLENQFNPERPSMLGRPVSPSQGGWGEAAARSKFKSWLDSIRDTTDVYLQRMVYVAFPGVMAQLRGVIAGLDDENLVYDWLLNQNEALLLEGEEFHPDQMDLSLVELVRTNVESIQMIKPLLQDPYYDDIDMYGNLINKIATEWLNRNFVQEGEMKYVDPYVIQSIRASMDRDLSLFVDKVVPLTSNLIAKAIIVGMRDYLVETKNYDQLEASYDPLCIAYIRSAIGSALDGVFDAYKDTVSGIIIKELENGFKDG